MIIGRWEEVNWRYERFDGFIPSQAKWIDGIRFPDYLSRRIVRHEAEYWEFQPGRVLVISTRDGQLIRARWRLKGRGHVLVVRYPNSEDLEIYDVKELTADEMIINYDIGMEVRGIAQLRFRRMTVPGDRAGVSTMPRAVLGSIAR